ncbi:hypothetical protein TNCT_457861 [Trichonephila clavata]|nr:hypothetical protein TNCT_457861 [Trichonephila clavata]
MQKPLHKSYDESNFGSPVLHSSPLPSFVAHSTEINGSYEDSTECVQVDRSNTSSSCLEVVFKDLSDHFESNCAFNNAVVDLGTLTHKLMLHTTVKDFCSHHNTHSILSQLCIGNNSHPLFYKKKYPEINLDNGDFEIF